MFTDAQNSRLESRIERSAGCWLWTGRVAQDGYGRIRIAKREYVASRAAYLRWKGPIPCGLWVLHKCDTPRCCNPEHLFLGTHADNMADMKAKGRWNGPRGEAVKNRVRLTEAQAREVLISADRDAALARRHGVSGYCIWAIRNGRTWKHLPRPGAS